MVAFGWLRGPKPCTATSPKGYWCTRTDRHTEHRAAGGDGRLHSTWRGDFPSETELLDTFTDGGGFRAAVENTPLDVASPEAHNDRLRARG